MRKIYLFLVLLIAVSTASYGQYANMVINAADSTNGSFISNLTNLNGTLLYKANGKSYGYWSLRFGNYAWNTRWENEVWMSDGTEAGTSMIEINTATEEKQDALDSTYTVYKGASMNAAFVFNDALYFSAYDATAAGGGEYKMDASGNYTKIADWDMSYNPIVGDDGKVYYCTADYRNGEGRAIIAWDGVNAPDTLPYQKENYTTNGIFYKFGDKFLVTANLLSDDPDVGTELVLYDPTDPAGPQVLMNIDTQPNKHGVPKSYTQVGNKVFFRAQHYRQYPDKTKYLIYETDGTPGGTQEITAISTLVDSLYLEILGAWKDKLYFAATNTGATDFSAKYHAQMYQYDPAAGTVVQVSDILKHYPMAFDTAKSVLDGWLYYPGSMVLPSTDWNYRYLFRTDGSTVEIVDTVAMNIGDIVVKDGKVYFEGELPGVSLLSDGTLDYSGYELMVYDPNSLISNNAFLTELTIADTVATVFHKYNTKYTIYLPKETVASPQVGGVAEDAVKASVVVTQASSFPGTATIVVTAEDGTSSNTYTVEFAKAPSIISSLSEILIDDVALEGFDTDTLEYTFGLPYGHPTNTIPNVTCTPTDADATFVITDPTELPDTTVIVVTAEDGISQTIYEVIFEINPPSTDSTLSGITIDGMALEGFDAATLAYTVHLPYGHSANTIPVVVGTLSDANATMTVTDPASIPGTTSVVVLAEDGIAETTYTIDFQIMDPSDVCTLSAITIDGEALAGFDPDLLFYDVKLPSGHASDVIPVVVATQVDPNSTVNITNPESIPGSAVILVTAEDGVSYTNYTIDYSIAIGIDHSAQASPKVYPTMSDNHFNVELGQNGGAVKVYNMFGQMVLDKELNTSNARIHLEHSGMYIMVISNGVEEAVYRIVKR
ncbi:MAG: T9SS type A sorting domain-containing protein [Bacteroidota bacterium]